MSGLCHRCEHRVRFIEDGQPRPRFECGETETTKHACYLYRPVTPCLLKKDANDQRPQFGPAMIASRSSFAGLPRVEYRVARFDDDNMACLFVIPRGRPTRKEEDENVEDLSVKTD